ncbi:unnamed protein product [Hyaloperonospora brassicae]|uniref:Lysine transporter LysE n=1 Tax=Hyaloperonospora brassicae TaxID=162125 RepID=A0AAV0UZC2_HYABA|nr:unnamed protein product [Hyaloperonospora brassicae]
MLLPLHQLRKRYAWAPYRQLRRGAIVGLLVALALLFLFFSRSSLPPPSPEVVSSPPDVDPTHSVDAFVAPEDVRSVERNAEGVENEADETKEAVRDAIAAVEADVRASETLTNAPLGLRLLLPLVAGFCFGFLGSVPIAGPTSAMVLKLGIQGKYAAGLTIAVGGAIAEATYAGVAFWGFGSFLAGAKFLLPVSKVLGAIMFTLIGLVFLKADMTPSLDPDVEASHGKSTQRPQTEVLKNVLMGLTMSGINPALLASYTGAIASVYGTGMLEFTLSLAIVFALGVSCGVSTWFYLLLSLLKKYKQRLNNHTIDSLMRGLGCFLLALGILCAKSSVDYFLSPPPDAK